MCPTALEPAGPVAEVLVSTAEVVTIARPMATAAKAERKPTAGAVGSADA